MPKRIKKMIKTNNTFLKNKKENNLKKTNIKTPKENTKQKEIIK